MKIYIATPKFLIFVSATILFKLLSFQAQASLLTNGTFETNGGADSSMFSGWTIVTQSGGEGSWFAQSGSMTPFTPAGVAASVPTPPEGSFAAMTNGGGQGTKILYQDFVVPSILADQTFTLSMSIYIANRVPVFSTPNSLSYLGGPNQQARVDIISPTADILSVAGADIFQNIFQTTVGSTLIYSSYHIITSDLTSLFTAHQGETLRLRFAEVENIGPLTFGVDNVAIIAVPEPRCIFLILPGILIFALQVRPNKALQLFVISLLEH